MSENQNGIDGNFTPTETLSGSLSSVETLSGSLSSTETLNGSVSVPNIVNKNYNELTNKPQISGVELSGNKSLADLGIAPSSTTYTKTEVDNALEEKVDTVDAIPNSVIDLL